MTTCAAEAAIAGTRVTYTIMYPPINNSSPSWAIAGTSVTAVAPLPMTTTLFPA